MESDGLIVCVFIYLFYVCMYVCIYSFTQRTLNMKFYFTSKGMSN